MTWERLFDLVAAALMVGVAAGAHRLLHPTWLPARGDRWRWGLLALFWAAGGAALAARLTGGLGAVTNLTDRFPWGVWKIVNVIVGIALAAGGFITAGTVHVFRLKRYYPYMRPAVLAAYLGYTLAMLGLLFDIGRPLTFWHPVVYWNHHSVLFEITWCIMLYSVVLTLEFMPALLERVGLTKLVTFLHWVTPPFVIAGIVLSTLHQSSLGGLFLIVPEKMLGLWYSPLLPVFFLLSAILSGLSLLTLVAGAAETRGGPPSGPALAGIRRVLAPLLFIYLFLRAMDLVERGPWAELIAWPAQGLLFLLEATLFTIPAVLLLRPGPGGERRAVGRSAVFLLCAVVLNRLDVAWFSLTPRMGWYFPAWGEAAVSLNLLSYGVVIYAIAVRHLRVFPQASPAS